MNEEKLGDVQEKIEKCQASAESLLRCAQEHGRVIIVTLSSRGILQRRCEIWYPRVWKLLNDSKITIVYAIDTHRASLQKNEMNMQNPEFSEGHWAWVKGKALTQEVDRFYSQYKGQTWKNVISIGDSKFEIYGTVGAAGVYVQKRFSGISSSKEEDSAYVKTWTRFDSDPSWSDSFEGVHEGHLFKVRTKVMQLVPSPS